MQIQGLWGSGAGIGRVGRMPALSPNFGSIKRLKYLRFVLHNVISGAIMITNLTESQKKEKVLFIVLTVPTVPMLTAKLHSASGTASMW